MRFRSRDLAVVLAFVLVTSGLSVLVVRQLGGFDVRATQTYHAVFSDASGLRDGSQVRASGVAVGSVEEIALTGEHRADVTFSVEASLALPESVLAKVRYANLTGDRYLELTPGSDQGPDLEPGGVIPETQTTPALDLDALFGGFQPLFQALDPEQVNELSSSLIEIFQGQSLTMNSLLDRIGSFTSALGSREQLVGRVVDNLNTVLATLDRRRPELAGLIDNVHLLVQGLSRDRRVIGTSLARISHLGATTAELVAALRPELRGNVVELGRFARILAGDAELVDHYLTQAPRTLQLLGRAGAYGSFFNFYSCGSRLKLSGPPGSPPVYTEFNLSKEPRCSFPQ